MRKKTLLTAGFILVLFLIAIAEAGFVKFAQANPYMYYETTSPPAGATPLEISVSSPKNNTVYRVNDITFTFNISTNNTSIHYLLESYFKADWMQDNVTVYKQHPINTIFPEFWNYSKTFRDMPDGEYSIVITARGDGGYAKGLTYYFFDMTTISVINFTVEAAPPKLSILSLENKTYNLSDVPLNFTVDEAVSKITYALDGQKNVTVAGNTTLAGLPVGVHNVTVYAWDAAGNIGLSETITFTVAELSPSPLLQETETQQRELLPSTLVVASVASVTVICAALLVYFRKHKKELGDKSCFVKVLLQCLFSS